MNQLIFLVDENQQKCKNLLYFDCVGGLVVTMPTETLLFIILVKMDSDQSASLDAVLKQL